MAALLPQMLQIDWASVLLCCKVKFLWLDKFRGTVLSKVAMITSYSQKVGPTVVRALARRAHPECRAMIIVCSERHCHILRQLQVYGWLLHASEAK